MNCELGQKRAKAGGELGANGEWYEGGKFIATKDRPKAPPAHHEISDEEKARRAAKAEAEAAHKARYDAWMAPRSERIAELVKPFLSAPQHMTTDGWAVMLETGHAGFHADLARQLQRLGNLTQNQARYFVKAVMGRETSKNSDAWNELFDFVTEQPA